MSLCTRKIFVFLYIFHLLCPILGAVKVESNPIFPGTYDIETRKFARIPNFKGVPPKIVGIVPYADDLFVTTSVSGGRIWKASPSGAVRLWFDVSKSLFRTLSRRIDVRSKAHGGVRGLAFHPRHEQNGLFYVSLVETRAPKVNYTYLSAPEAAKSADSVVYEWKVDLVSRKPIPEEIREVIRIAMPVLDHPIKQIAFRGSLLYIAHGDASEQSATTGGGLKNDALGKILRINPLRRGQRPYIVPKSNPFVGKAKYLDEIFAVGFRNPHNLCFSRRGELFVADAGRDNVEEINIVYPGENYGWAMREGHFVHLPRGGVGTGIKPLPPNDAKFRFRYPVAVLKHTGEKGKEFVGQAIAGGCPIENGSPLHGLLLYANFPTNGNLYYSKLKDMRRAVTRGNPKFLTVAPTFRANILYDHDKKKRTPPKNVSSLIEVIHLDKRWANAKRADVRFGKGSDGTIYWSSKTTGWIYVITNSRPGSI